MLAFGSDQQPQLPREGGGVREVGDTCAENGSVVGQHDVQDRSGARVDVAEGDGGSGEEVQAEPYQLLPQRRSVLLSDLEGSLNSLGDSFRSGMSASADMSAEVVGSLFSQVGLATFGDALTLSPGIPRDAGGPTAAGATAAGAAPAAPAPAAGGQQPTTDLSARYAAVAAECLDLVLDVEGLQWGRVTESGGVEISRLREPPPGAGDGPSEDGEVLRATLRVGAGERAVARVLWDWAKRTTWDRSCRECRFVHKFDSHHSLLALSHGSTEGGAGEGAEGADNLRTGGLVELQVLLSRRFLPPTPVSGYNGDYVLSI